MFEASVTCDECVRTVYDPALGERAYPRRTRDALTPVSLAVFSSGRGTNFQTAIDFCTENPAAAQINAVYSNRPGSMTLERASETGISAIPHISRDFIPEGVTPRRARQDYVADCLRDVKPDILLLLGFDQLLYDHFLVRMQEQEIAVANIHPALLTPGDDYDIRTTRATIPVLRGLHATEEAYRLELPVSGVTVHQILPGNREDVGPIVYQQEVSGPKFNMPETMEMWARRLLDAHPPVLTTALQRMVHVIGAHNIDTSRGQFSWINNYGELP